MLVGGAHVRVRARVRVRVNVKVRFRVRVRVRVIYVFEPLMTPGIEPGSGRFCPRPWFARPKSRIGLNCVCQRAPKCCTSTIASDIGIFDRFLDR